MKSPCTRCDSAMDRITCSEGCADLEAYRRHLDATALDADTLARIQHEREHALVRAVFEGRSCCGRAETSKTVDGAMARERERKARQRRERGSTPRSTAGSASG